jgi:hypothetical protein
MQLVNSSKNTYENITKINELFLANNFNIYNAYPSDNQNNNPPDYDIIYTQGINICNEYKLRIDKETSKIHITIPLKNSNASYRTSFSSLDQAIKFLEFHIWK